MHVAEQVELEELPKPVVLRETLPVIEALLEVTVVGQVVKLGGVFEETLDVLRRLAHLAPLGGHLVRLGIEIKRDAVLEEISPMRSQRADGDVILHLLPAALEQALEEVRQREDGRAEIEGVALLLERVQLAPNLVVFLKDLDVVAGLSQRDGSGQPTQPCADDDDFLRLHACLISSR